jgi:hypothetical protein
MHAAMQHAFVQIQILACYSTRHGKQQDILDYEDNSWT